MTQDFEVANVSPLGGVDEELLQQGMMQTKAQYTTAVQTIKPRNKSQIILKVEEEAVLMEDEFYYSWGQGKGYIEGLAVGGAQIIARNWGNCAVNVRVEDRGDSFIFYGDFIDFETGYNLTRPFRASKKILTKKDGKAIYERERNDEIVFQIAASKASRNVIANSVPKYLISKGIAKAKEGVRRKMENLGAEKAIEQITNRALKLGIEVSVIEGTYGKKEKWDVDKFVMIAGALRTVEDGYNTISEVFKVEEDKRKEAEKKKEEEELKPKSGKVVEKKKKKDKEKEDVGEVDQISAVCIAMDKEIDWSQVSSVIEHTSKIAHIDVYKRFRELFADKITGIQGSEAIELNKHFNSLGTKLLQQ